MLVLLHLDHKFSVTVTHTNDLPTVAVPTHGLVAFQMSLKSCFEFYQFNIFHGEKTLWLGPQEDRGFWERRSARVLTCVKPHVDSAKGLLNKFSLLQEIVALISVS